MGILWTILAVLGISFLPFAIYIVIEYIRFRLWIRKEAKEYQEAETHYDINPLARHGLKFTDEQKDKISDLSKLWGPE